MNDNAKLIEAQIMYKKIEEVTDPKEALEKLSTLEEEMGWNSNPPETRFLAYGIWLKKHGKEGWYDYLLESGKALQVLFLGGMPSKIPEAPEGWIPPVSYFRGEKLQKENKGG